MMFVVYHYSTFVPNSIFPVKSSLKIDRELLYHLFDFRPDDRSRVSLIEMACVIILVVLFRRIKRLQGSDFRHEGFVVNAGIGEFLYKTFCGYALVKSGEKDDGTILGADIVTLPVQAGRIMAFEKDFKQFFKRNNVRVVFHQNHFRMPSGAGGY